MPSMKRPYQIAGTALFLFAVFIAIESRLDLTYYTPLGPGPGFFPFWLSVLMGILSAIMLCQATFQQSPPRPADFYASRIGYLRAGAVCIAIIAVVFLMEELGFRWTMVAFYLFLLMTLGRSNLWDVLLVTVTCSLGAFSLFDRALKVPLPQGPFDAPLDAVSEILIGPVGLALVLVYVVLRFGLYRRVLSLSGR